MPAAMGALKSHRNLFPVGFSAPSGLAESGVYLTQDEAAGLTSPGGIDNTSVIGEDDISREVGFLDFGFNGYHFSTT